MKELIRIDINENQEPVVNGRELYQVLGIKTPYTQWFDRMKEYGFAENVDFISLSQNCEKPQGGRPEVNHAIKLDMAKEIAMIQRNEKGKEVRQYFIKVEKDFNSPEKIMARALMLADKQIKTLQVENEEQKKILEKQKPKVIFADSVETARTSILVGELAKIIKQNGYDIGQNRMFEWLRCNNYLISRKGTDYNMPTQKAMKLGLFDIKETSITHADGHISVSKTPKVTGKGQVYFISKFIKD